MPTGIGAALPAATGNGRARAAALQGHSVAGEGVGTVAYRSRGNLLIVGPLSQALSWVRALQPVLRCMLLVTPGTGDGGTPVPADLIRIEGHLQRLAGYLGQFDVGIDCGGRTLNPASLFGTGVEHVDLVLDLSDRPFLDHELPPPGYYAPAERDPGSVIEELRGLVGEFEKPKYFHYDPAICAHGRSGLAGCRRCIDACPTRAIRSAGERIEVDPYLCQGAGSCASACPGGAIRYAYPGPAALLGAVRDALGRYRQAGGTDPQVLFFDDSGGRLAMQALAGRLPESVLPFQLEEAGSLGMDAWLATLAYGARRVVMFVTNDVPRSVLREISLQISYTRAILGGMGYRRDSLQLVLDGEREAALLQALTQVLPQPAIEAAGFTPFDEKRTTLGLAIDHLQAHSPAPGALADLPADAPFGTIEIEPALCTLCMACVAACPAQALYAASGRPALQFIEHNCVQCGLCHAACPEDAVRLHPRMDYDGERRRGLRTLHEAEPLRCNRCGKPFATRAVVERLTERLADHWMFRDERARRRIGMCQDCRVLDMYEQEGPPDVHGKPARGA